MKSLQDKAGAKLTGIVLDLRNNPGGLLDQAIAVRERFPRQGRDRLDPRPAGRGRAALRRQAAGRHHQRPADGRADQWRLGLGVGDRRRRAPGSSPRDPARHALLRQGLGPDHHPAARPRRHAPHHRALLHAVRPLDPGQGHRARHRRRAGQDREDRRCARCSTRPICAARSRTPTPIRPTRSRPNSNAKPAKASPDAAAPGTGGAQSSTVDASVMGTSEDYQLARAVDMLRGLALFGHRTARVSTAAGGQDGPAPRCSLRVAPRGPDADRDRL